MFKAERAEDLEGVYQQVASELHSLYSLAYAPRLVRTDGKWRRIGIAVSVDLVPPQRAQDREYRATFPSFDLIELATDLSPRMVNRWHSRQTPLPQNRFVVTGNGSRYQNPALDGAIDRYLTTIPRDARLQALAEILERPAL